jgi:DNA-binding transcriptional LysR family regulator
VNDKLEFLIALAREKHFGRAAEACGVTQPTLSAGIRQLEEGFGVLLVNRGSRYLGLTLEGERVLEWARRIVGDTRAMRADIRALREGLVGHLRIAAVPTALAMVPLLTNPYRERHPGVRFTVHSCNSIEIFRLIDNLEVEAGLTYLDNEPLGRVRAYPLYQERYRLLTSPGAKLGDRERVTWAEVARIPLCLLTPDMQNRRILNRLLSADGHVPTPAMESNSMIALVAHVRTGKWATVMPERLADTLGLTETIRAIPIVAPDVSHTIGLVVPPREPMTPLCAALVQEATRMAANDRDVLSQHSGQAIAAGPEA